MDLTPLMAQQGQQLISGYAAGFFTLGEKKVHNHLLISNQNYWEYTNFDISEKALENALAEYKNKLQPIVIIGCAYEKSLTLAKQKFSDTKLAMEIMDSKAACRSFNMLSLENRQIIAYIEKII